MIQKVLPILTYKLTWTCIAFQNLWATWTLGPLGVLTNFYLLRNSEIKWQRVTAIAALGLVHDGLFQLLGILSFPNTEFVPLWLPLLWIHFATLFPETLSFLGERIPIHFVVGAIGGWAAYSAGASFGILDFHSQVGEFIYSASWGLLFSLQMFISRSQPKLNS